MNGSQDISRLYMHLEKLLLKQSAQRGYGEHYGNRYVMQMINMKLVTKCTTKEQTVQSGEDLELSLVRMVLWCLLDMEEPASGYIISD